MFFAIIHHAGDFKMGQLPGFDYKRPFFYMVTIKKRNGLPVFSELHEGKIRKTAITQAFLNVILRFHRTWYCIEAIRFFVIMPDHLHLIIKIRDIEKRVSLRVLVRQLIKTLQTHFWEVAPAQFRETPVFEFEWHDWIVMKPGQLAAFRRYIEENPMRTWTRHQNRAFFTQLRDITFLQRTWHAYGNPALLELPVLEPFQCSRSWLPTGGEWQQAQARATRIGPGGAGVGTFMSPCEKACGNAIFRTGGAFIVLHPEGFAPRWHPTRNKEKLCAEGRMLFLSLYAPSTAKLDRATLYRRCHEMGDIIMGKR